MAGPGRPTAKKAAPAKPVPVEITQVSETVPPQPEETDEQKRIRELEEQIKALTATLETQTASSFSTPPSHYADKEGDKVLIHFLDDGFTSQGAVWYRGQEVEVTVGDDRWTESLDRNGDSWLSMTEADQLARFEKVYFRRGPWPGKSSYRDGEFADPSKAPPESELERADKLERERRRAAPRLPDVTEE